MNKYILHLSYRDYNEVPKTLKKNSAELEEIYLKENHIMTIPLWLFQLTNLKFIHLAGNLLTRLPDEISLLVNLEFLDVSSNQLKSIPKTIGEIKNLTRFSARQNQIEELPTEIGRLSSLQIFDISFNLLRELPIEMANCTSLVEFRASDNPLLTEIPDRIMMIPSIETLEVDRCGLMYLPSMVSNKLVHLCIFNNTKLTHFPVIYEKFLKNHYDYWSEAVVSADLLMVFVPDESKHTNLPRVIRMVHSTQSRNPFSLFDFALKSFWQFSSQLDDVTVAEALPKQLYSFLRNGPTAICGSNKCPMTIHSECYFVLMKKSLTSSQIIFSSMFCSKDCADWWLSQNSKYFHPIKWSSFM